MEVELFTKAHNLKFSSSSELLIQKGMEIMSSSRDPLHTEKHVYRIIDDLDQMIAHVPEIPWSKINYEVLILSIIWHDTYKSRNSPKSKRKMFFDHVLADGLGSMRLFNRYAKKSGLPKKIRTKVAYAIRKHSIFQILPRLTWEAKVLKILDELEDWSFERIEDAISRQGELSEVFQRLLPVVKFYFSHWLKRKKDNKNFPPWVRSEYIRRKTIFMDSIGLKVNSILNFKHRTAS